MRLETAVAWSAAIRRKDGPTALLLSRQNLPFEKRNDETTDQIQKGGYVLADAPGAKAVLIATGSEVQLALAAQKLLDFPVRVVSMPSTSVFDRQDENYRAAVLPKGLPRVAIEAGVTDFWRKYVGLEGRGGRHRPLRRIGAGARSFQALRLHAGERRQSRKERSDMTIKVAINGFGRIGRNILRAFYESRNEARPPVRRHQRPRRREDQRAPAQVRHRAWPLPGHGGGERQRHEGQRPGHPGGRRARSVEAALEGARRGRRARVHGPLHQQGQGRRAPRRRREEGDHLRARRQGRGPHRGVRRQPPDAEGEATR